MTDRIIGPDQSARQGDQHLIHGTCICIDAVAALLIGRSGTGKSGLALQMMAFGADLIADDQTLLTCQSDAIEATCPSLIRNRIEARGVGLLCAQAKSRSFVRVVIDMEVIETDRLPPHRSCRILGFQLPLLHKVNSPYFAAAIVQYLKGGRCD